MNSKILLIIPILFVLSILSISQANAASTQTYPITLVIISESCKKMEQYNIKSDCPKMSDLMKYDTSNQNISGKFIKSKNDYIRTNAQVKNSWMFYSNPIVCVDCNADYFGPDQFKTVIIEPSHFTYVDKYITLNNTLKWTSYSDRYMQGCTTATIGWSDYLLNDTLSYMKSNCTVTSFNGNKTNIIQDHPFSFENPYSSLIYKKQIDDMKKTGIGNCINNDKCKITASGKRW